MSDPSPMVAAIAALSAAPAAAPVEAPPAVAPAPPPAAAPEAPEAPKAPEKPRTLNPWAKRAVATPAPVAAPVAAPTPEPIADPRLAALTSQVDALRGVLSRQATSELAAVPDNVRAYVAQIAGTDPAKQLDTLHAMRAAGLVAAAPASVPAGASTMAAPSAPAVTAAPNPDALVLAAHARLAGSPIAQAAFESANAAALARARAARPS